AIATPPPLARQAESRRFVLPFFPRPLGTECVSPPECPPASWSSRLPSAPSPISQPQGCPRPAARRHAKNGGEQNWPKPRGGIGRRARSPDVASRGMWVCRRTQTQMQTHLIVVD